jgi:ubiquinol-cytochrome c reductase cytochrome b subunit
MKRMLDWLDHRTGMRGILHAALYESVPGGARWRYVWGSTLVFAFVVQIITGTVLWMCYSPSTRTAWESVYYIQHEMTGGWLLRGIHHFMAQIMILLLIAHVLQVVIAGAYRAPREFNYWTGLVMLLVVLGLSLTGYLLPWDQKGYWATSVATSLMTMVPYFGAWIQQIVVGGPEYGHHTLTRFFAMHAGVLPGLLVLLTVLHIMLFRRHGVTAGPSPGPAQSFWPHQVWRDSAACLGVMAFVLLLTCGGYFRHYFDGGTPDAVRPGDYLGAELSAPADPSESFAAARPEWYFLFLYQLLKYFEGGSEIIGALVIPGLAFLGLALMPLVGRSRLGHRFNVLFLIGLLAAAGALTAIAVWNDRHSPEVMAAIEQSEREAERVKNFVRYNDGIPLEGAISLMRRDPEIQGPRLFAKHCQGCHSFLDESNQGLAGPAVPGETDQPYGAPNLYGFASRAWLTRLLDPQHIDTPAFFGGTAHREGEMSQFVHDQLSDLDAEGKTALQEVIASVSAEAELVGQRDVDAQAKADGMVERGREAIVDRFTCVDCHRFHDAGDLGMAPDLTGYGSLDWITAIISNPAHERFYADRNDRMPAFAESEQAERNQLTADEIRMLAQWLRGDMKDLSAASF